MNRKRVLGLILAFVLLAREGLADVLVLRDGTRLEGTIANREQLKSHPQLQATIAIMTGEPEELRRVAARDVEYVVLEGADGRLVIDPSTLRGAGSRQAPASPSRVMTAQASESRKVVAKGLLLSGMTIGLVAGAVKFGSSTSTGIEKSEYNVTNYAMAALAGVLITVGFLKLADSEPTAVSGEAGPSLSLAVDHGSLGVGAGWRLGF